MIHIEGTDIYGVRHVAKQIFWKPYYVQKAHRLIEEHYLISMKPQSVAEMDIQVGNEIKSLCEKICQKQVRTAHWAMYHVPAEVIRPYALEFWYEELPMFQIVAEKYANEDEPLREYLESICSETE